MTPEEHNLLGETLDWCAGRDRSRAAMRRRMQAFLACQDLASPPPLVIKIAGTNGKGSVAAMLEAALTASGTRAGAFCSPHLVSVTERIRIGGRPIEWPDLAASVHHVLPVLRALCAGKPDDPAGHAGPSRIPSFFEVLLLVAFEVYHRQHVQAAVIEAGVGGSNDATSLLPAEIAVITSVAIDHRDRLGDSIAAIAADKAGIAVPGRPLILGPGVTAEARIAIETALDAVGQGTGKSPAVVRADRSRVRALTCDLTGSRVVVEAGPSGPIELRLPLPGRFQLDNLATTAQAVETLADLGIVGDCHCLQGIAQVSWPGRLEHRPGDLEWLLDVAHNPEGLQALSESLEDLVPRDGRLVLLGSSKDEALAAGALDPLLLGDEVWLVDGFYRAIPCTELGMRLARTGPAVRCVGSVDAALQRLQGEEGARRMWHTVIVTGSVFLVGAVRRALDEPWR